MESMPRKLQYKPGAYWANMWDILYHPQFQENSMRSTSLGFWALTFCHDEEKYHCHKELEDYGTYIFNTSFGHHRSLIRNQKESKSKWISAPQRRIMYQIQLFNFILQVLLYMNKQEGSIFMNVNLWNALKTTK